MKKPIILFVVLLCLISSCIEDKELAPYVQQDYKYIFLGHTYRWHYGNNKVDQRLEQMDYSNYDEIWLGGDMCSETTLHGDTTLQYLDSIFDLSSTDTHWTLGNHDARNGNLDVISKFTGRETFYTQTKNGFTRMILNTCYNSVQVPILANSCDELDAQFEMIKNVTDTIQNSSHLVIISHGSVWREVEERMLWAANYEYAKYEFNCSGATFKNTIYPMLVDVQLRGVDVVYISGDYGQSDKAYEYTTTDGITFLGSGINNSILTKPSSLQYYPYVNNFDPDSILILEYNVPSRMLTWKFENLNIYNF